MLRRSVGMLAAGAMVLALDQATKAWVVSNLGPKEQPVLLEGFLRLRYTENTGAAFGLFQGWTGILSILAVVVVVAIIASAHKVGSGSWASMLALGLITGGAIGNIADRVRLGYVVDFIEAHGLRANINNTVYTFPVFNIADSAISIGVVLLLLTFLLQKDDEPRPAVIEPPVPDERSTPWLRRPDGQSNLQREESKVGE